MLAIAEVAIDAEKFDAAMAVSGLESEDLEARAEYAEADELNGIVQTLVDGDVFVVPEGAMVLAYFSGGEDPYFLFGMRPRLAGSMPIAFQEVNVCGWSVEMKDIEPIGYFDVDFGATRMTVREFNMAVAKSIARELTPLLIAYDHLFG